MATKAKDSNSGVKKEKVTPSSNSHTIRKQPNPKSAATSSIIDKDKSSTSSKPVPNYLRPTFSSRSESLKELKEDANQKLLRRRSFDRPPSAARAQKSLISPDPKKRLASRMATRSSSFSASRTPSTAKPVLERNSRSLKPITSRHLPAAERTSSVSKNSGNNNTASRSLKHRNSTDDETQAIDHETMQESLVQEIEEITNVDTPEAERKEVEAENDITKFNDGEGDEKVKNSEINYTVVEEQSVSRVEDTESELHQDHYEDENKHEKGENQEHSSYNQIPEKGITEGAKIESSDEKTGEENVNEEVAPCEVTVEEKNKKEDMEEGNDEGSEEIKSKEGRDQEVVEGSSSNVEEINNNVHQEVSNNAVGQRQQAGQGKKESPTAYNDVIEETKNKLLEKRKNKVKALVGAFETVIDYETAAGSNK